MPATPQDQAVDLALMQGVAKGDPADVARLYDRFSSLIYRMAYQVLPNRDEAEDAVQEIFIRLWRTAARYDPTRAALVTWVMLLSRRYLVDRLRRTRASLKAASLDEKLTGGDIAASAPENRPETAEKFAALMRRIDRLPELQRTVVTRAYLNGQTLRQIGEELNTPLGTIKSALSRALVRLREREFNEGLHA
ncbi:MAG: sigma-70 family RNA polymerase sigma factor [Phycisphaeraceae bacterium]|nr:sigma-70 family RNA polymerase sigma factor [Phycisphaeraceae bacterium]